MWGMSKKVIGNIVSAVMVAVMPVGMAGAEEAAGSSPVEHERLHQVIDGGQAQSTDPAAYDYIPEVDDSPSGEIQDRSASGYEPINGFGFTFNGVPFKVTTGELQHRIIGSGNYIESEGVQYRVPSTICNWRVDYQNRSGAQIHRTFKGQKHAGCGFGAVSDNGPRNVHVKAASQQCARLFVADKFRGEQCHNIG